MPLSLHFVHGWGCDASLWDRLAPLLADWPQTRADRGYFGGVGMMPAGGPILVVAHSHGVLRSLLDPPPGCAGLVAINGFDRFGQGRVLDRMIARFAQDPAGVLDTFRARVGLLEAPAICAPQALGDDLVHMRDADALDAAWTVPLVALHGGADPILPGAVRDAAFARVAAAQVSTLPDGGHLLPLTHSEACAGAIRTLAGQLA